MGVVVGLGHPLLPHLPSQVLHLAYVVATEDVDRLRAQGRHGEVEFVADPLPEEGLDGDGGGHVLSERGLSGAAGGAVVQHVLHLPHEALEELAEELFWHCQVAMRSRDASAGLEVGRGALVSGGDLLGLALGLRTYPLSDGRLHLSEEGGIVVGGLVGPLSAARAVPGGVLLPLLVCDLAELGVEGESGVFSPDGNPHPGFSGQVAADEVPSLLAVLPLVAKGAEEVPPYLVPGGLGVEQILIGWGWTGGLVGEVAEVAGVVVAHLEFKSDNGA